MPVESKNAEIGMAAFNGLENGDQQGAPSTKNPNFEDWQAYLQAEYEAVQLGAGFANVKVSSPTSGSEVETPKPFHTPSSSSSSSLGPPSRAPHPRTQEFKTPQQDAFSYVGYTVGKRKVYSEDEEDTFAAGEMIHNATMSKRTAEKKIRSLELRYDCDLSKKHVKSELAKLGTLKATIKRLETELKFNKIRLESMKSKEELYDHVTEIRAVAKLSENSESSLRPESKKCANERQDAEDEYQAAAREFMRAKEKRERAMANAR